MRKMTFIVGYWPKRSRFRRPKGRWPVKPSRRHGRLLWIGCIAVILFLLIGSRFGIFLSTNFESLSSQISLSDNSLKQILSQGLPILELENAEYMSPVSIAARILSAVTTVNLGTPKGLLESQFAYMDEMEIEAVSIPYNDPGQGTGELDDLDNQIAPENIQDSETTDDSSGENNKDDISAGQGEEASANNGQRPLVGLYTTHNSEKYAGEVKSTTTTEDEPKGVVRVATVLEKSLRDKYKIAAARSQQVHDYPDWNLSYTKSKETGKSLLAKNPSIQVLIDIHRDAGIKEKQSIVINGRSAAKVLIIVGSAQRLDNPNWEQNKQFAEKVDAKMDEIYPGLSRGVRVQTGRYNQHLHPHAILLEMGNAKNSLSEAEYSAELMAHVISEILKDISANQL